MSNLKNPWRPFAAVACLSLLVACSSHDIYVDVPANNHFMMMTSTAGNVLATPTGMTLYTFDKDTAGHSNCYADCAQAWPPMLGDSGSKPAGNLTLVPRSDGSMQWAIDDKPLYTFVQDKRPGEVKGENFRNVWHVVHVQQ